MFMIFHHSVTLTKSWEHIFLETVKNVFGGGGERRHQQVGQACKEYVHFIQYSFIIPSMFKTILNFASMRLLNSLESNTV